jgi:chromate transporter
MKVRGKCWTIFYPDPTRKDCDPKQEWSKFAPVFFYLFPVTIEANQRINVDQLDTLFWVFLKINLLSTSGAASTGLLYNEAVGRFLTEEQFVQAVGLATLLPGSDALQLAMFVGYTVAGIPGGLVSLFAAILPPTILMFALVSVLHRLQREAWLSRFVEGLTPAVAVLILTVSWKVLKNGTGGEFDWIMVGVGGASLLAYYFEIPAPFVILAAGLIGTFAFR